MYKPRRTTEFHEEAREEGSVLKKRQTRSQLRATITPMKKSGLWHPTQSRLTQFSPSCSTKLSSNVSHSNVSSATPLRHRQGSSAERAVALHKDKKWVQEQSQLIAECFDELMQNQPLPGFANDFFSRGGASLRQMTMKQFVAIVNYLFQLIFGNRVNVGSNHVEEITKALHKLKYPYQVNKSWLMTPTTQHSIGHVIVMLDFLKDLALPSLFKQEELGPFDEFPFMETSEQHSCLQNTLDPTTASCLQMSHVVITEETNHLLFPSAAESFGVWDTQNWDEYAILKRNVSDQIIKGLCDLPDTNALDDELLRLRNEVTHLDEQLQQPADNKSEQLQQLKSQEQQLQHDLTTLQTNIQEHINKIEELHMLSQEHAERMSTRRKEIQQLQRNVESQTYTCERFQSMKMKLNDLRDEEQYYKQQMQDFTEHSNNQQVRLSRAKKQLLDKVQKFNSHAQNIGLDSDICSASEKEKMELVLPLPPQYADIQKRSHHLSNLAKLLVQRREQHEQRCSRLEQNSTELTLIIEQLQTEQNKTNARIELFKKELERLPLNYQAENSKLPEHRQQLIERNFELSSKIDQLKQKHVELTKSLQSKKQEKEEFLSNAEKSQADRLQAQDEFVKEYSDVLTKATDKLKSVESQVKANSVKLANYRLELEGLKLPSFEEELNKIFN